MAQLSLNEPAGVLVKTTCVDYPGRVAGSFFLRGCNLLCPYCYNRGLVLNEEHPEQLNTVQELFDHLKKRQGILSGVVISGGEPLINHYTPLIIKEAKLLGYKVKLDTNGTFPDKLRTFRDDKELRPDFIALDIKTSPKRYATTMCPKFSSYYGNENYFEKVLEQSAALVAKLPSDCREWRTVLVPFLVTKEDIKNMAELLPKDASWQFTQFQNGNCIDSSYNNISPYTDRELKELVDYAKTFIPNSELR